MDKEYLSFCTTDNQRYIVRRLVEGATKKVIAAELDCHERSIYKVLETIKKAAARAGYSPKHDMTKTVPPGYKVRGVSTYYDEDGKPRGQWVKSQSDETLRLEAVQKAIEDSTSAVPQFKPTKPPKHTDDNLATLLTITDYHLGMKAWEQSDGDDWDITIARQVFLNAIHDMIDASPASGVGILNQLGDFLHWDGLLPVTPTSKHILIGTDDRYSKLVELSISVMTEALIMMLKKFGKVVVVQAEGNHDLASSVWMRKFIKHRFENDKRVEVVDNDYPFYAYLHGKTMLGFHHGHRMKMVQLQKLFASEPRMREMWGKASFCYIHCGHLHHERVLEDAGAIIEQHPTLAARDHYASSHGYVSNRGAKCITYDMEAGEVSRITVRPRV